VGKGAGRGRAGAESRQEHGLHMKTQHTALCSGRQGLEGRRRRTGQRSAAQRSAFACDPSGVLTLVLGLPDLVFLSEGGGGSLRWTYSRSDTWEQWQT